MKCIVIRADLGGGPYAWESGCIADAVSGFKGSDYSVSPELEEQFCNWVSKFESHFMSPDHDWADLTWNTRFDWEWFNRTGIDLAGRLKVELGDAVEVAYQKAVEDPGRTSHYTEYVEMQSDGSLKWVRRFSGENLQEDKMNE